MGLSFRMLVLPAYTGAIFQSRMTFPCYVERVRWNEALYGSQQNAI